MDNNYKEKLAALSIPELQLLKNFLTTKIESGERREERDPQSRFSTRHGRLVTAPAKAALELQREHLAAIQEELDSRKQ